VSSLSSFFLALKLYPEVQRTAQEEIDRVVGADRLPNYEDRESLAYVDAVVKEVLRWHPIGPMGLPHKTDEDDVLDGYLIPKGALLLPNIW
jgi:cytochrome P450